MTELKLECLVEGYEGTYFEVGQVWETRGGRKIILKDFIKDEKYPLVFDIGNTYPEEFTLKGTYFEDAKHKLDLVRLISAEVPTESTSPEPQPKTLSEYLKENNAYESFVENCVEDFLNDLDVYYTVKSDNDIIEIGNTFMWDKTKEGREYWNNLYKNQPENLIYDMNEIVFAEVDKRIAEQKPATEFISTEEFDQMLQQKDTTKYMVFVEGRSSPKKIHDSYDSAEKEAKRLSAKEIGCNVMVLSVVKTFKSKVIVEEVK